MPKSKSSLTFERAILPEELPPIIPRVLGAKFGFVSPRTLKNHEYPRGPLHPIRRNSRTVSYRREEILQFFGFTEPAQPAAVRRKPRAIQQVSAVKKRK
jgi:hypothetical protein